ncbi:DMT family transporter [Ensifer soli]|uniref:DMT family transporter n=1 Tax=Ciceribacter sp. sgz301302 TaxID=3342379 RepID=UPI0035B82558
MTATTAPTRAPTSQRTGILLVLGSALVWSFGGTLVRFLAIEDGWTVVFWRSLFAALFLLGFLLWRDGRRTGLAFREMGLPGVAVALCFAVASMAFVLALAYTTVANVVLIQAGVPLIAALAGRVLFGESVSPTTWAAIAAVIAGVAIMVSGSITGRVSPVGDVLALVIAFSFATATVITRRYAHLRMTPAVCLGTVIACAVAATQASGFAVTPDQFCILSVFGAFNFGLGLALFVTGARLLPAALAALIGTLETVLGPLWVALIHGEVPGIETVAGGLIVLSALLAYLGLELRRLRGPATAGA